MTEDTTSRPPYAWAGAVFAIVLAIYVITLAPTTAFWDTSEYIAAAKVLGIPHPPGNPLFTLMAHVWGLLPLAADYAKRINLFAAVTSAGGAALWFLVADRWMRSLLPTRLPRLLCAFAGILASATAWTVWNQSTVNEKVYTVSLLSIALIVWLTIRWADLPREDRSDRYLVAAVYLLALTSTNHMMGVLAAPVVGVYVLLTDWRVLLKPRFLAACVGAVLVGLTLDYVYLPIRAGQYPPINEGEPVGFFSKALSDVLGRAQYGKPSVFDRQSPIGAQLWMYWNYWSWQWGKDLGALRGVATGIFTALGLTGLWSLYKHDRRAGLSAAALLFTLTLLLIYYLNFRYAFTYHLNDAGITTDMREVRERDYFFLASFAYVGVLIAAGFATVIRGVVEWLGDRGPATNRWRAGAPVLALALLPILGNWRSAPRDKETLARDFAVDMLESVEPYGILITAGDNDTFPLWFAQEVLGVRRDVTLANLSLMNTDWHLRQIRRRVTPAFDPSTAAPLWRPGTDTAGKPLGFAPTGGWPAPTNRVLNVTEAGLDSIQDFMLAPAEGVTIDSVHLQFGTKYLTRSDIATILLIRDNIGKRPIYFSWSDGMYPDHTLGLGDYLLSEGMVRRVMPTPITQGEGITKSEYIGWVNAPRTRALLFGVYHPEAAAKHRDLGWFDPPSQSILQLYQLVYAGFSPTLRELGDSASAERADSIASLVVKNLR